MRLAERGLNSEIKELKKCLLELKKKSYHIQEANMKYTNQELTGEETKLHQEIGSVEQTTS